MKKSTFKKIVDEKNKELSAKYLISLKNSHSKSTNLKYGNEMQPYLRNENLSIQEKKVMFRIKNRLIDVKSNQKSKYKDNLECRLCSSSEESQPHLVVCSEILTDDKIRTALAGYSYSDIFSTNLQTQTHLIKTWMMILKNRKLKLNKL